MAKEAKPEAAAETAGAPRKSKKLLIIIIAAVLVLALAGGGAAYFLLKGHPAEEGADGEEVSETAKPAKKSKDAKEAAPVYVALDQFTVNLAPENGDQYLQVAISIQVEDAPAGDHLKTFTPKLRNDVMVLLSGKKASELMTRSGKEALAGEIRGLINAILDPKAKADAGPAKEVLFTSFIIQ
jgi:flagellar FliL protein